jgi:hypothetical protein
MDRSHAPDSLMPDFAVVVCQDVALGLDRPPGYFGIGGLERGSDVTRRLADDFDLPFHGAAEHQIGQVVNVRPVTDDALNGMGCREHVP